MEEKKLDVKSIIGFGLIFLILIWVMYNQKPTDEEVAAEKAKQEQLDKKNQEEEANKVITETPEEKVVNFKDSLQLQNFKSSLGAFQYSVSDASDVSATTVLENELVYFKISNKGGQIVEARLKNFVSHDSLPIYLIKDGNASFNINFGTTDNRVLNTKDLVFAPGLSKNGENTVLSMKLKASENQFLEFRYELKPNDYLVDFTMRSQGLSSVFNTSKAPSLEWDLKTRRESKSLQYENRYTELTYQYEDGKIDKLSETSDDEEKEAKVTWISYRQHFFSSILVTKTPFETAALSSENFVEDESKTQVYSKGNKTIAPLAFTGGELNYNFNWYYGPTDVKVLDKYTELNLDDSIPYGWGIFGIINRYVFTPLYGFLSGMLPYGIAIIVMTVLVRLAMSPVTYKSYLSQAKMKVLKPEITEINDKFKDNAMKKQQATMKLYSKAGVSPMKGCIPALLQLPIFYSLFMFFPSSFALRQKSFLWANDLSAYDSIYELGFTIPFYGDHVSLFPILASIAIFFYMMMTTGQSMQMQQQPGMPNMKFIMYLSPLMMLVFFNSYASGLSLYYFVSNLITILIMLTIKNFILDEDKIHAQIEEQKKKAPKKKGKFQRKLAEIMEQAEAQKTAQEKNKRK